MPIYDYRCTACNHSFEALVKLNASAPACPSCGAAEPERQLSRLAPAGQIAGIVSQARAQASREGHFSHYSKAERARAKV